MGKQLLKSTAVAGGMTLLSRILGFIRDMLIARVFGADAATDTFFAVFKIPNFLRRLFVEGAFAQAFVPVLSDYKQRGGQAALREFIDKTGGVLALALLGLTIIGMLAAPLLILAVAPGFLADIGQYALAVQMLQIVLPYLFFIGCTAFAGGILNTYGQFAIPAVTPAILNICMIAAALWFAPLLPEPMTALAWSVFAAGALQLLLQFPALLRLGLLPRLRPGFSDAGVKRIMGMMLPAIFGVSVTQINLLLDTLIASFLAAGSVSWLYYSDRLVEFPLGMFGATLATVILPALSREYASGDVEAFSRSLDWGLRLTLLLGLPAAVGLMLMAQPLTATFYQYDAFSAVDMTMAARSMAAYALGLPGFMLIKILVPGFAARHDARTPARYGIYALFMHLVLGVVLLVPLAHAGLALATSLAASINAGLLLAKLLKDKVYRPSRVWGAFLLRLLFANAVMAVVLLYGVDTEQWMHWAAQQRIMHLALWIGIAIVVYALALLLSGFKIRDFADKDRNF